VGDLLQCEGITQTQVHVVYLLQYHPRLLGMARPARRRRRVVGFGNAHAALSYLEEQRNDNYL